MVELKPTKAVVGDPEAPEYAATVPFPDVGPHDLRDRVPEGKAPGSPRGGVATQHGRTEEAGRSGSLRRPRSSPRA